MCTLCIPFFGKKKPPADWPGAYIQPTMRLGAGQNTIQDGEDDAADDDVQNNRQAGVLQNLLLGQILVTVHQGVMLCPRENTHT